MIHGNRSGMFKKEQNEEAFYTLVGVAHYWQDAIISSVAQNRKLCAKLNVSKFGHDLRDSVAHAIVNQIKQDVEQFCPYFDTGNRGDDLTNHQLGGPAHTGELKTVSARWSKDGTKLIVTTEGMNTGKNGTTCGALRHLSTF